MAGDEWFLDSLTKTGLISDFEKKNGIHVEVVHENDRKIMSEVRPIDLSYQILDALRSLTGYDHSSAVLMSEANGTSLKVVAEQIAWRKAKSNCIGATLPVSAEVVKLLQEGSVFGFTRINDKWDEWEGRHAGALRTGAGSTP